jgi:ABC-type dipeptide/oligopeptide/nickel transport system permease subunit
MSAEAAAPRLLEQAQPVEEPIRGQWSMFWRRFRRHRLAVVSGAILLVIIAAAILAPVVAPYDPDKTDLQLARFGEPAAPSLSHPFGSDNLGRDQLSRVIYGARVSLVVGFLATGVSILMGMLFGALSGYFGRWTDMVIMRVADVLLAFPPLLFLFAALTSVRPTITSMALLIAIISPEGYDDVVLRGDTASRVFSAFWLHGGRVLAAMHANDWDQIDPIRALVGREVSREELADPAVALADVS